MKKQSGRWKMELYLDCPNTDCLASFGIGDMPEIEPLVSFNGEVVCPYCGCAFIAVVDGGFELS